MALWTVRYEVDVEADNADQAEEKAWNMVAGLKSDNTEVELVCDHSDTRKCQGMGHAVGPDNEPS